MQESAWLAPAKLNLFLHITAQRPDGYHELQTVFQLIDYCDELTFELNRSDSAISCEVQDHELAGQQNICVKAAESLRRASAGRQGVRIKLHKRIPVGAGLGGGSSDAATTLMALNQLWQLNLEKAELLALANDLGADVPVFVNGYSVWAEGTGEVFQPIKLPEHWYLVVYPNIKVSTREIFSSPELTRTQRPITIADFLAGSGINVMESVVLDGYPEVNQAYQWLAQHGKVKMSGSGSCLFLSFESEQAALQTASQVPKKWTSFVAAGLNQSPVLMKLK